MVDRECSASERIYSLDYLRYWLVLIVVVFHCVLSQATFLPTWVIVDPRQLDVADWLIYVAYIFQMALLFFIAGYFAIRSLRSKGTLRFVKRKIARLLVPAAFVLVFLNPVHRYLFHYTRSFQMDVPRTSFLEYWPTFFQRAVWFEMGDMLDFEFSLMHLWFVTLLFVFFAIIAIFARLFPGLVQQSSQSASTKEIAGTLLGTTGGALVIIALLLLWFQSYQWIMVGSFLLFEVPMIGLYVCYFALGVTAYRRNWFSRPDAMGPTWRWAIPCALLSGIMVALDGFTMSHLAFLDNYAFMFAVWTVRVLGCLCFLGLFTSFALRCCNRASRIQQHFAAISYRVYLIHLFVVVLVQFLFLQWTSFPPYLALFGTMIVSLVITYVAAVSLTAPLAWISAATNRIYSRVLRREDVSELAPRD